MQILFFPRKQPRENFFLKQTVTVVEHLFFFRQGVNYLLFFMLLGSNHQIWGCYCLDSQLCLTFVCACAFASLRLYDDILLIKCGILLI